MPTIPVNLGNVEAYENLPLGEYLGQISKITYKPPREQGKFPQLMVTYTVIDGELLGRTSNEWLSLSPKAAFRLKKWFAKFGLGDTDDLQVDDDSEELTEPDLVDIQVIFKVHEDKPRPGETEPSIRTSLVSVEDELEPATTAAQNAPDPEPAADDSDVEPAEEAAVAAAARPARREVARPAAAKRRQLR